MNYKQNNDYISDSNGKKFFSIFEIIFKIFLTDPRVHKIEHKLLVRGVSVFTNYFMYVPLKCIVHVKMADHSADPSTVIKQAR